jgi:hypothetical protein
MKNLAIAVCLVLVMSPYAAHGAGGIFGRRVTHQGMVAASGIQPARVAHNAEGVGMSTRSERDAIQNCCYWGQRTPVSIQTKYHNGAWHAVVRYR